MLQPSGPIQSSYTRYLTNAEAGMPASMAEVFVDTKIFEEHASPPAGIGFGLAVQQGTADRGVRLGGSGTFVGITRKNVTLIASEFTDGYAGGDNTDVWVRGDIWCVAEAVVTAGEAVYYNPTTGVLGHSGGTVIDDARWMTSTSGASQLAVCRLGVATGNADAH
jgi:hypothetical protein